MYNGRIWRQSGKLYDWILINQETGRIVKCGNGELPDQMGVNKIDMKQQWVFPGFHDCHSHIADTGNILSGKSDLQMPRSIEEFQNRIKNIALKQSSEEWVVGYNWDHHLMKRFPTAKDIDAVISDVPVVLYRVCCHICVVNSMVLSKLGISKSMLTSANTYIGRFDDKHEHAGEPNGLLFEDDGVSLVMNSVPELSSDLKKENILLALNKCLKEGITSVHTCEGKYWNEYVSLAKASMLPICCYFSPYSQNFGCENFPSQPKETYENLSCDIVKIFIDGALGCDTALLSLPYQNKSGDDSDKYGRLQKTEEEFKDIVNKVTKAGFRLEIHVIGDKAAEIALDLLESCSVSPSSRPLFVHCQILREDLLDRLLKCGVVPTIQPSFVPTDAAWIEDKLPPSLRTCIYPWKTLLQKGLVCGGSSDTPVETTNPLQGIYDAIFRLSPNGTPFIKSECLTFVEAVNLYTCGSAYADYVEHYKGKLEKDFQADLVVLDVPLLPDGIPANLPENPKLLKETTVKEVWIKGKLTWSKGA